ncbi:putative quinol monooxygenase [Dyadobacter sp. CY351]|uniref:putative quinol monooxygenase n=1 Tax=Dyadobacter sp. CY351 TaxID=2909337 RepID=UPI001F45296E|nr:putative quinol monooxygenase [Dyadobacter sp. CY351]MCF2518792.1 antibiotic biosynthesis monooxygenase [Dyadobacter sp. CY351]
MSANAITTFAKWQVKSENLETVLHLLADLSKKSKAETDNLFYQVFQDQSNPNVLVLFEGYTNEAALTAHRNSAHFQEIAVKQIIPLLENREVVLTSELNLN